MRRLILCCLLAIGLSVSAQISIAEREALIDLYEATHGDQWKRNSGWKDDQGEFRPHGTEAEWFGLAFDSEYSHVVGIDLDSNDVAGSIPQSISDLKELRQFSSAYSQIATFPKGLLELPLLERLNLKNAGLSGQIPEGWERLQNLEYLDLSGNELLGAVPESFQGLTQLASLSIYDNALTTLPDLSGLANLWLLEAQQNLLSGPVPIWIAGMEKLTRIDFSANQFTGSVPQALASPGRALQLNLSHNQIDHFPLAEWSPDLEMQLQKNLLTEADCEALRTAYEDGARLVFLDQKSGLLSCDVMTLRQSLPWISNIADEWESSVTVFNPSSQKALVQFAHPEQSVIPFLEIHPTSLQRIPLPKLESGFQLKIYSDNPTVFTSYFVAGEHSPSGRSPAMTRGQKLEEGASHLMFPVLPGSLKSAFAIQAVEAQGETVLSVRLYGTSGILATTALSLQDDESKALLIPTLFPGVTVESDLALEVIGPPEIALLGTAFAFNDLNEPAMVPAIAFGQASSDWVFPWAASNDQFASRISIFNPGSMSVQASIVAIAPDGESFEVQRTVDARRHASFDTGDLFSQLSGYSLRLKTSREGSTPQKVFANIQVGNREQRPSGASPALTHALDPNKLSAVVALPLPTLEELPAIVLQAPDQTGSVEVLLFETRLGTDSIIGSVILEHGRPKPILLKNFEVRTHDSPALINAIATSGEPIAGTVFYFNDYREPAMMQGVNQTWFNLNVSLSYQAEEVNSLVATVENSGPFTSPEGVELIVSVGEAVVYRTTLDPLGLGERVSMPLADELLSLMDSSAEIVAKIQVPSPNFDRDHADNQSKISLNRMLELAPTYRLSPTYHGDVLTGILHADEETFEVFFSRLVLLPMDELVWELERLNVSTVGSYQDADYQYTYDWQAAAGAQTHWDSSQRVLRISSLETSAVYRLSVAIRTPEGDLIESPTGVGLSKSAFDKRSSDAFGQPEAVRRGPRVYHPFDDRNWIENTLGTWPPETAFSGDDFQDGSALLFMQISILRESEVDLAEAYVVELPEGLFNIWRYTFKFFPSHLRKTPMHFKIQGAGKDKTFLAVNNIAPEATSEGHAFSFRNRISFRGFDRLSLKDFALWGATPTEAAPMEVSGRPNFEFRSELRLPYAWFAGGIGITEMGQVDMDGVDLRFHSVALSLEDIPGGNPEEMATTQLRHVSIGYCESAITLRDMSRVQIGPGNGIHHVSSQGILGNRISDLVIEETVIDGARHRGINLDRTSHVWLRNNMIRNSGHSGIHLGGDVHYAAMTGNVIQTVNRDRENPFGDENSVNGTIMSYRPLYEGIKSVRGRWGDSSHLLIADNEITDVANGIAVAQGNASEVLIENNTIEAMQRGIRLEYGKSKLFVEDGFSFEGYLSNLFVMPDNRISLLNPIAEDNPQRHGILFDDADPECPGCNIGFMASYGEDLGRGIAFYPFPIEFASYDACGEVRDETCVEWQSNESVLNVGPVYLPILGENDYQHPAAQSVLLDETIRVLADELRQKILEPFP